MHAPERRAFLWALALLLALPATAYAHPDPLAPYRWVAPPRDVAPGNIAPLARTANVPAERDRLPATEVWTGDLQAVLALAESPLPARDRTTVSVALVPRDAAPFGRVPAPLTAAGNAYEVTVLDSDGPIAATGRLTLAAPQAPTAVLFSPDGSSWTTLDSTSPEPNHVEAAFERPGYYLAAAERPRAASPSAAGVSGLALLLLVALPIAAVAGLVIVGRRSARHRAAASP